MNPEHVAVLSPGKLIIIGEYAVMEGAAGVVMAVDRHVVLARGASGPCGLVDAARAAAAERLGVKGAPRRWFADSSELRQGRRKLGIGSSAAVAAGAVASLYLEEGRPIEEDITRVEMWDVARAVHDSHQGSRGSGIDVAASLFGGFLVMRGGVGGRPSFARWIPPAGARFVWVWTGTASSTPSLVRAVREHARRDPIAHGRLVAEMAEISAAAASVADPWSLIGCLTRYGDLMHDLGRLAGVEIVTPAASALAGSAIDLGGAAKPSGAGGGDFVVAVFGDEEGPVRFTTKASAMGMTVMDINPASRGTHTSNQEMHEEWR